jgi:hypothetical protein
MHSLVAFGFLCDEFNLRLGGVCGCKNGGAHDQKFSTAQRFAAAFFVASAGVCALFFMFFFRETSGFKGKESSINFVDSIPLEALREVGTYRAAKSWQEKK